MMEEKEQFSSLDLQSEYIQNVKRRLEDRDESFDNWMQKYGMCLQYKITPSKKPPKMGY